MEYIFFWLAKPLADLAWLFIVVGVLLVAFVIFMLYAMLYDLVKSIFKKNAPVAHKEPENEH